MSCLYCGGSQREQRNPNRCWGCGAAVPRGPSFFVAQPLDPKRALSEQFLAMDPLTAQMQALQNDTRRLEMDAARLRNCGAELPMVRDIGIYAVPRLFDVLKIFALASLASLSVWAAGGFQ